MEIYLVRHTTPAIAKGICYGQADVGVAATFVEETEEVRRRLPTGVRRIISSTSSRCKQLALALFPMQSINYSNRLQEINCGDWELKPWSDIEPSALDHWMKNYETVPYPGGESYHDFRTRIVAEWNTITQLPDYPTAIVTHAGVIRVILSHVHHLSISEIDQFYDTGYGCVIAVKAQP